ncbi:MAG: biotin/lipoyl-containing protein [Candidatus Binatia bacterium]
MARHRFVIQGKQYEVEVGARVGATLHVTVNGRPYVVGLVATPQGASAPAAPASARPAPAAAPASAPVSAPASKPAVPAAPRPAPARPAAPVSDTPGAVRAPIPGVVLAVSVQAGDKVTSGTKLLVLEAMKMENEIFSVIDGTVKEVHVGAQQEVRQGELLVTIE